MAGLRLRCGLRLTCAGLLCVLVTAAGCTRDTAGPASSASAGTDGPGLATSAPGPSVSGPSGSVAGSSGAASAPPIVTGTSRPPGGGTVAAAPPPCSELKPLIDRYLTDAKITREAPGKQSGTCYVIGAFQGARVDAQLQYGRGASDQALRTATGAGCSAETRPLKLPYKTALGCDNPTGGGHSGAGLAQGASFAVAAVTVTGDAAGTAEQRAAVTDAARKLAANVLQQIS